MDISETAEVKEHEKCFFETPHKEIKCVLSVKESSINEKKINFFTFAYGWPDRKISAFSFEALPKIVDENDFFLV